MDLSDLFYRRMPVSRSHPQDSTPTQVRVAIVEDIVRWFYAYRDFRGTPLRPFVSFDTTANEHYITITVYDRNGLKRRDLRPVRDEVGRRLADHYPALETLGDNRIIIAIAVDRRHRRT